MLQAVEHWKLMPQYITLFEGHDLLNLDIVVFPVMQNVSLALHEHNHCGFVLINFQLFTLKI